MKKLIIVGAGGFAREVAWLVERINATEPVWELLGFTDDNPKLWGNIINGYPVLGGVQVLVEHKDAYVVCAVGSAKVRKLLINKIQEEFSDIRFATLVDPTVQMSQHVEVGEGSIICAGSIATVNILIGAHVHINLDCTIGHDAVLEDFVTVYPSVNISGMTRFGQCVELGTGAQITQGISVGTHTIIGAGAVVIRDIPDSCTAVGNPAKVIKEHI